MSLCPKIWGERRRACNSRRLLCKMGSLYVREKQNVSYQESTQERTAALDSKDLWKFETSNRQSASIKKEMQIASI